MSKISHDDYTIGWICALSIEMAAATAMLDHINPSRDLERHPNDNNTYTLGSIGDHNVVIACLPSGEYGLVSAATVANQMSSTFTRISSWLMVGIGGGVPDAKTDIRLGDIVVGHSVIQYDYGKTITGGRFERTGTLKKPSQALLTAINKLRADHEVSHSQISTFLSEMLDKNPQMRAKYNYQGREHDFLFEAGYDHVESQDTCEFCNKTRLIDRHTRSQTSPMIHYGLIASGNQVMKHGNTRNQLKQELGILCFEMEAAGLMDSFPCLVIRGICDYADSHKNKKWQEYSAAAAAAYTKELLLTMPTARASVKVPIAIEATDPEIIAKRKTFMGTLKFDQIGTRRATIGTAHWRTGRWLLTKPEYEDWLDDTKISEHHGFLWIKGKPGAGKSTIMKFALKNCEEAIKDSIIICFFFNARGEYLEKSTTGMYRSLLYQLLSKIPGLQAVFDSLESPEALDTGNLWNINLLKDTFSRALSQFGQERLVCFIDALDECDENEIRDMLAFFKSIVTMAELAGTRLHICFSSRHYPHITFTKGRELILESQKGHSDDIVSYLHSELEIGSDEMAKGMGAKILDKAAGIFLWVVLVVQILNKEYDRGNLDELHQRLEDIPKDLSKLFKDILTRGTDDMEETLICIEWILYAKRPLRLAELYFAIMSSRSPGKLRAWDSQRITEAAMGRSILDSSKGLADLTKSSNQTVQFIHESVRDFLLKENGLCEILSEYSSLGSHERLKNACRNYMGIEIYRELRIRIPFKTNLPRAASSEAVAMRELVSSKFPFLQYAVQNIFYHADLAANNGNPQETFLENFNLGRWIGLNNIVEEFQIRRYKPTSSLLYIVAGQGLLNLVKIELKGISDIDIKEGARYSYPIIAALLGGYEEVVKEFLISDVTRPSTIVMPRDEKSQRVERLLKDGRGFKIPKSRTLLSYAAQIGSRDWVEILLATGKVDIEAKSVDERTPLSYAAASGNVSVVEFLLANGANVETGDIGKQTPLIHAVKTGHEIVVKKLLDYGAQIDRGCPLKYAADNGDEKMVALLLQNGANPHLLDQYPTMVFNAAMKGHISTIQLLLDNGIDIDAKGYNDQTLLAYAASRGHLGIVQLLLDRGANIHAADNKGQTPLWKAALKGQPAVVRLLLERGSGVDHIGFSGIFSPPSIAPSYQNYLEGLLRSSGLPFEYSRNYRSMALSQTNNENQREVIELIFKHIEGRSKEKTSPDDIWQADWYQSAKFRY
ncbi:hypothetical protein TWF506_005362 [Arthrobotrys conoides]|uniref:Nucleoside phosphorylase domain-containing protein n=1 Tax=Arthrobotrys conoides TaxID=74498 RepID=A0AAN8RPV1_9PEZI